MSVGNRNPFIFLAPYYYCRTAHFCEAAFYFLTLFIIDLSDLPPECFLAIVPKLWRQIELHLILTQSIDDSGADIGSQHRADMLAVRQISAHAPWQPAPGASPEGLSQLDRSERAIDNLIHSLDTRARPSSHRSHGQRYRVNQCPNDEQERQTTHFASRVIRRHQVCRNARSRACRSKIYAVHWRAMVRCDATQPKKTVCREDYRWRTVSDHAPSNGMSINRSGNRQSLTDIF